MAYLISYDLRQPGRDYSGLQAAIEGLGPHIHCLESVWIVAHFGPSTVIESKLRPFLDVNDKLIVVAMSKDWTTYHFNTITEVSWLRQYV